MTKNTCSMCLNMDFCPLMSAKIVTDAEMDNPEFISDIRSLAYRLLAFSLIDKLGIDEYDQWMEFLETISDYIGPWIWLLPVPIIIFSAIPRMPLWYKSGRILFLWLMILILIGLFTYAELTSEKEIPCCLSEQYVHTKNILILFWMGFLINVYIGWWEFLWRCIYRQWSWPLLKNVKKYGLISNLCILGSAAFTVPLILLLTAVSIHRTFFQ